MLTGVFSESCGGSGGSSISIFRRFWWPGSTRVVVFGQSVQLDRERTNEFLILFSCGECGKKYAHGRGGP